MINLGKLEQIDDLRSIWENEARDFTPWLARTENLALLSDAVDIKIQLEERESNVGDFSVDLYATEEGTGRKIIIENQLESTNHDHLGKIITYASGKDAEVIIWIVRKARDEHRQAIEWLNQHTDEKSAFFLIEIEVWKINDSAPAAKFNIVERPNNWAKAMKRSGSMTESAVLKMEFWEEFNNNAYTNKEFLKAFNLRQPQGQHWYDLAIGSSAYHLNMAINTQKGILTTGVYINGDKEIYMEFKEQASMIQTALGTQIEWRDAKKASRFFVSRKFDINNRDDWQKGCQWLYDMCLRIRNVVKKIDQ